MKQPSQVMIVSGGTCNPNGIKELIINHQIDTIIAVDGGLKILDELNIMPDYIVGDFDTVSPELVDKYRHLTLNQKAPVIRSFQPEKDDTDTEIAIRLCIELQAKEVVITAATGTRLDHTLANIHLLKLLLDEEIPAAIYDLHNKIYLIQDTLKLKQSKLYGKYFSMLPFTQRVTGITLTGFKYPLTNKTIDFGTSLCISNEVIQSEAVVELNEGILIVFESYD